MQHPPMPPLSADLLARLEADGESRSYEAGEVLVRESDPSTHFYVLLCGELEVYTRKEGGRELVFATLRAGDYFGELSLDGNPRSASVRATTASRCLVVPVEALQSLVRSHPEFAWHLVEKLIHLLRQSTRKLKSMALDDAYERIVALIDEEAVLEDGVRYLPRSLTQQEIARRVGASREMVNHVLGTLKREGLASRVPGRGLVISGPLSRHG